jgi:hypothetical protein
MPVLPSPDALSSAPGRDEAAEYYFRYIDLVPAGDIVRTLEEQGRATLEFLESIGEQRSLHRYAFDKWSIRSVVGHLSDCERLFAFRAFWFARGFDSPLPSFDQNIAVDAASADARAWPDLIDEFRSLRASTVALYRSLPPSAWERRGIASGNPFTVRALAYLAAGHVTHHVSILRERYLG